jgi:dihydroxy-acid dehydratase
MTQYRLTASTTQYGDDGFSRFLRSAFLAGAGYERQELDRPVIGIADTTSDFTPCHRNMPQIVESLKRGVLEAGGLPFVFPTINLGEIILSPTSMLYRNLAALETEEMIAAQPMDAAVLLGGCDKTVPAQLMAAASSSVPVILEVVGPMSTDSWRGERLGTCTDCRRMWAAHRAGDLNVEEMTQVELALVPTPGTCTVMGTASTMACMAEALGMMLPGGATPPSFSGERLRHARRTGRRAVEIAREPRTASEILTSEAFENALTVLAAMGGSTNAVIHLLAIARRAGIDLAIDQFDAVSRSMPVLLDVKPTGAGYMEDFHRVGGLPRLLAVLKGRLHLDTVGISGESLGQSLERHPIAHEEQATIRPRESPVFPAGGLAILRGSLAPDSAVLKVSAASTRLLQHTGPALVFDSVADAVNRLDDPHLDVTAEHVLVLRNAGPVGAGMPEAGSLPIHRKLAEAGVIDMVRITDARMSGTAYGTVVLHCSPEAAVGGPLALVRDGDLIELNVRRREVNLLISSDEWALRQSQTIPTPIPHRGWMRVHMTHVMQANEGADLDFLSPSAGAQVNGHSGRSMLVDPVRTRAPCLLGFELALAPSLACLPKREPRTAGGSHGAG